MTWCWDTHPLWKFQRPLFLPTRLTATWDGSQAIGSIPPHSIPANPRTGSNAHVKRTRTARHYSRLVSRSASEPSLDISTKQALHRMCYSAVRHDTHALLEHISISCHAFTQRKPQGPNQNISIGFSSPTRNSRGCYQTFCLTWCIWKMLPCSPRGTWCSLDNNRTFVFEYDSSSQAQIVLIFNNENTPCHHCKCTPVPVNKSQDNTREPGHNWTDHKFYDYLKIWSYHHRHANPHISEDFPLCWPDSTPSPPLKPTEIASMQYHFSIYTKFWIRGIRKTCLGHCAMKHNHLGWAAAGSGITFLVIYNIIDQCVIVIEFHFDPAEVSKLARRLFRITPSVMSMDFRRLTPPAALLLPSPLPSSVFRLLLWASIMTVDRRGPSFSIERVGDVGLFADIGISLPTANINNNLEVILGSANITRALNVQASQNLRKVAGIMPESMKNWTPTKIVFCFPKPNKIEPRSCANKESQVFQRWEPQNSRVN